jgi:Triosephosphate isomerase
VCQILTFCLFPLALLAEMKASSVLKAAYSPSGRKFFVGGNWKANGTTAQVQSWVATLNSGNVASSTEVVVAPPAVYIGQVASTIRKDFGVSSQVCIDV